MAKSPVSVDEMIQNLRPQQSVCCIRPKVIARASKWFVSNFPGDVLYAVKSNPDPFVLKTIYKNGVRNFDVASLYEIDLIAGMFPDAKMYFMHTVKSREAIRLAYFEYGVRDYSLDTFAELEKIMEETKRAKDLCLHLRLAVPNMYSELDLSGKFGVPVKDAPKLLREVNKVAKFLGISFHVGSQCMHPNAYSAAVNLVRNLLEKTRIKLDYLDVGGGFPSMYPGMTPPPLESYVEEIGEVKKTLPYADKIKLMCEPGRALVAESCSLVVKVELRKNQMLYINDGVYGSLFDAGTPRFIYPTRLIKLNDEPSDNLMPYSFYGPTCDSIDVMKGPFYLPDNVEEGDYIEIGQLGAYGRTMQTNFNGFHSSLQVEVRDKPLMSVFDLPQLHHNYHPNEAV